MIPNYLSRPTRIQIGDTELFVGAAAEILALSREAPSIREPQIPQYTRGRILIQQRAGVPWPFGLDPEVETLWESNQSYRISVQRRDGSWQLISTLELSARPLYEPNQETLTLELGCVLFNARETSPESPNSLGIPIGTGATRGETVIQALIAAGIPPARIDTQTFLPLLTDRLTVPFSKGGLSYIEVAQTLCIPGDPNSPESYWLRVDPNGLVTAESFPEESFSSSPLILARRQDVILDRQGVGSIPPHGSCYRGSCRLLLR